MRKAAKIVTHVGEFRGEMEKCVLGSRKRGRKRPLTDSTRKRKRRKYEEEKDATRVYIGGYIHRWNAIKAELNLKSNPEVAGLLLSR